MHVVSYSEDRNRLKRLCDEVCRSRVPVRIKRRDGDVVMVAAEDWDGIQETLYIQSVPSAVERIKSADDFKKLNQLSSPALKELISDQT